MAFSLEPTPAPPSSNVDVLNLNGRKRRFPLPLPSPSLLPLENGAFGCGGGEGGRRRTFVPAAPPPPPLYPGGGGGEMLLRVSRIFGKEKNCTHAFQGGEEAGRRRKGGCWRLSFRRRWCCKRERGEEREKATFPVLEKAKFSYESLKIGNRQEPPKI